MTKYKKACFIKGSLQRLRESYDQSNDMAEEVKLFKTLSSPFALRVDWALRLKGIQYESVLEDLSEKSDLLLQYNPVYKKVPVLLHNGRSISESLIILEYIEETWKQDPLLPQDPYARARARFWAKFGDDKVLPSLWTAFISEGKEQEAALAEASENLQKLEGELNGKKFFGGDNIGYLDIALGWLANLITVFEEISSLKLVDGERFPLLLAWMEFSDVPLIKDCWPPHDKLIPRFIARRQVYRMKSSST
ncbi:probable glutathione S-transferase [Eucalyptus grandis]|uniref:probable glutathione S-transferase n=1 Tax=Eucalyptus grandis TaxID=71139 RepID=UPI00192EE981|nr:probable glutathione S-transferase [Eucalyptus grandis]